MSASIYPMDPYSMDLPLIVFGIGYEDNQPDVARKDGFPLPQLFICLSGEGTLKINGESHLIKENTFFYLPPGIPHEYCRNTEQWELYWIVFSGPASLPLMDSLSFSRRPRGELHSTSHLKTLCRQIFSVLKKEDAVGKAASSSILYEIMTDIYVKTHMQKAPSTRESALLQKVKTYIDENYAKDLTLEELAKLAGISSQYLCRLFQKHMKLRPFEYLARKRIQQAKILLSDPDISVSEAARMTGYHDCSYFCSVFKKQERISPSEFRGR